jgi:NADH dehydrogenase
VKISRVCILGGTGFVGRHLCVRLQRAGIGAVVPSRRPQRHPWLAPLPLVSVVEADLRDTQGLAGLMKGCQAVVNLVGILNEGRDGSFRQVHVELVDRLVDAGRAAGIHRFLHMSALNADEAKGASLYLRTKGEGENRAHTLGGASMAVTSFRPSVVFGPGDGFLNRFATLLRLTPGPFPLACPESRFAPVYVGDVAEAVLRSLEDRRTHGRHYELCGPRVLSLRELVEYTARQLGVRKRIVGLPDFAARLQARIFERMPGKPFTYDNYLSLQVDSVCRENGLEALGIEPTDLDAVAPLHLGRRSQRARLSMLRRGD